MLLLCNRRTVFRRSPTELRLNRKPMCGICGIVFSDRDWRVNGEVLAGMNHRIAHRGPADERFFVEENVGLAMRRLSIIDVKTGHQQLSNQKQGVWSAYKGEKYTHAELSAR